MLFSKQTPAAGGTAFAQFDAAWCYDGNGYILNDTGTSLDVRIGASGSVQTLASGATLPIKLVFSMAELYVRRTDQGTTQVTVEAQVGTGSAGGGGSTADMAVIAAASTATHNASEIAHGVSVSANAGSVPSSPNELTLATTSNLSGDREFISLRNATRIRSGGRVVSIRSNNIIIAATAVGFRVKFWRKVGSVYNLVGRSEDLKKKALAIGSGQRVRTISIDTPIVVEEGDYVSMYVSGANPSAVASSGFRIVYVAGEAPDGTDWATGVTTIQNFTLSVEVNTECPHLAFIGNSITAGHPSNYSMLEGTVTDGVNFPALVADTLAARWQNLGIGGQTTSQIAARFAQYVVAAKPKYCVIEGGSNDLVRGISAAVALENYRNMLRQCRGAGIVPVLLKQTPWTNGTEARSTTDAGEADGTTVVCSTLTGSATANYYKHWWVTVGVETRQVTGSAAGVLTVSPAFSAQVATATAFVVTAMTERDARWESIAALAASFPGTILIDLDTDLGENNTSGPAGNMWDIATTYNADGVHPNAAGYTAMAAVIVREIRKQWRTPVFA